MQYLPFHICQTTEWIAYVLKQLPLTQESDPIKRKRKIISVLSIENEKLSVNSQKGVGVIIKDNLKIKW